MANLAPGRGGPDDPTSYGQGSMTPPEDEAHGAAGHHLHGKLGHEPPGPNGPHYSLDWFPWRLPVSPGHRQRDWEPCEAACPEEPIRPLFHLIGHGRAPSVDAGFRPDRSPTWSAFAGSLPARPIAAVGHGIDRDLCLTWVKPEARGGIGCPPTVSIKILVADLDRSAQDSCGTLRNPSRDLRTALQMTKFGWPLTKL